MKSIPTFLTALNNTSPFHTHMFTHIYTLMLAELPCKALTRPFRHSQTYFFPKTSDSAVKNLTVFHVCWIIRQNEHFFIRKCLFFHKFWYVVIPHLVSVMFLWKVFRNEAPQPSGWPGTLWLKVEYLWSKHVCPLKRPAGGWDPQMWSPPLHLEITAAGSCVSCFFKLGAPDHGFWTFQQQLIQLSFYFTFVTSWFLGPSCWQQIQKQVHRYSWCQTTIICHFTVDKQTGRAGLGLWILSP